MNISYEQYLDKVHGGWIGKCIGGTIGDRFEGYKGWIEKPASMFPDEVPPNDDLDLQILWLKVLEEKGTALTSDDLAAAWLESCWYPFNEYGIFRRNWQLGIHPPYSGSFTNQFWETGMGCPIRAEIWGYAFPGAPDIAARYAQMDGTLDHTAQSVGAEQMFAAMASMAFFVPDVRRLASMFMHYLPAETTIARLTRVAFEAYDEGLSLRDARDRILLLAGHPEACDSQTNVPFTFLGLLYGGTDMEAALLAALHCGYDTDCTLATAGALIGQILGASRIPQHLKDAVGDDLIMGIQYRRPEMTLSALARDTARLGVLLAQKAETGVVIDDAPSVEPFPASANPPTARLGVDYVGLPAAAPGDQVGVIVHVAGDVPAGTALRIEGPVGWQIVPSRVTLDGVERDIPITLHAPTDVAEWPMRNLFSVCLETSPPVDYQFGVAGAGLWQLLGAYYQPVPREGNETQRRRFANHHFVSLQQDYLPEANVEEIDVDALYRDWSSKLGQPAVLASYEHEVDPTRLIGLRGAYCFYVARTLISPQARDAHIVIGNTDGYRLYLNGELINEVDECVWWTPFNNYHRVQLQEGANHLLLKLVKQRDDFHFTLGLRADEGRWREARFHNFEDWLVDLRDGVPA